MNKRQVEQEEQKKRPVNKKRPFSAKEKKRFVKRGKHKHRLTLRRAD